jgi:Na+/H+ antiporter NhaD/arsenite permease-like protein
MFLLWWVLVDLPKPGFMKFDKPTASLLAAATLVLCGVIDAQSAVASIEFGTILLLFGLFVLLEYLEYIGVIDVLTEVLEYGSPSPTALLVRVSLASGVVAALIMNDGAAVFLSKIVNDLCDRQQLPKTPYFLALATSANIGSASTILGNPKNMLIHATAHINFLEFSYHMVPPALFGLLLNCVFIVIYSQSSLPDEHKRSPSDAVSISSSSSSSSLMLLSNSFSIGDIETGATTTTSTTPLMRKKRGSDELDDEGSSSGTSDEDDKMDDVRVRKAASRLYRRKKQALSSIIKDKLLFSRTPRDVASTPHYGSVPSRGVAGAGFYQSGVLEADENVKSRVDLAGLLGDLGAQDKQAAFRSELQPLELYAMFDFKQLRKNWSEAEAFVREDANQEEEFMSRRPTASLLVRTTTSTSMSPDRRLIRMQGVQKDGEEGVLQTSENTPLLLTRRPTKNTPVQGNTEGASCSDRVVEFLQTSAPKWAIGGMYVLFALGMPLGWTCLLTSMAVVILSGIPPERLYRKVNFTLLFYIIGLFVTIAAVNKTPLANVFWNAIKPLATSDDVVVAVLGFSAFTFVICFVVTSIPCVLIIVPHLVQLNGPIKGFSWLLLSLCVTLCGNLTPSSSITGYIVSDYMVKNDPDNAITFKQWAKFSIPTTIVIMLAGSCFLDFNL